MTAPDAIWPFDRADLDDIAVPFLNALVALTAFSRVGHDKVDPMFDTAIVKALLCSLAAIIAHPHQDADQHDVLIDHAIAFLRAQVAEMRGDQ